MALHIRYERAKQIGKLMGELGELGLGSEAARQHLCGSMLSIVGAVVGVAIYDPSYREHNSKPTIEGKAFTVAGFDADTSTILDVPVDWGCASIPTQRAIMRRLEQDPSAPLVTASDRDLLPAREWDRSQWVNDCARAVGLDHFLSSVKPIGQGVVEATGFMRAANDRPFNNEERNVLHLVHDSLGRMFRDTSSTTPRIALAPRVEATLTELLTGATDKEIATRLQISVYTVRQYVKTIFRAYDVSSRALLIAQHHAPPLRAAS